MKLNLVKFLCKDCFSAFLYLMLVVLVVAFVTITCIAAPHRTNDTASHSVIAHPALQQAKELLKKKDMEIEERLRSGEPTMLTDIM